MGKINMQILAIQKQYFGPKSKLLSKFGKSDSGKRRNKEKSYCNNKDSRAISLILNKCRLSLFVRKVTIPLDKIIFYSD